MSLQEVMNLVDEVEAACDTTLVAKACAGPPDKSQDEDFQLTDAPIGAPRLLHHQSYDNASRRQHQRKLAAIQALQLQGQLHRAANNAIQLKKNLTKVPFLRFAEFGGLF
jgi:hypothetical protein